MRSRSDVATCVVTLLLAFATVGAQGGDVPDENRIRGAVERALPLARDRFVGVG